MPNLSAAEQAIDVCHARVEVFATYISTDSTKKQHVFLWNTLKLRSMSFDSLEPNELFLNYFWLYSTFQPNLTKEYFPPNSTWDPSFIIALFRTQRSYLYPFLALFHPVFVPNFRALLYMFFFVPSCKENRIFMFGVVFLFSQFSLLEIIVFNKIALYPIEDIDFLSSNLKRYFTSDCFL